MEHKDASSLLRRLPPRQPLTQRQAQVLCLLANGFTVKGIARELDIGIETVKGHYEAAARALQAKNRTEAAVKAAKMGVF